jgi:photosystem II stability/assembly factor-like uncharacterized protein
MKNLFLFFVFIINISNYSQQGWFLQSPSPTIQDLRDVFFFDTLNGWSVGDAGVIIKTTDGGENWNLLYSNSNATLSSVKFMDDQNGVVVGGSILKTTDGGNNWTTKYITPQFLWSVQVLENDFCCAVGQSGFITKSTDGGESWVQQTSGTAKALFSNYFINSLVGWVVGETGVILKTTDGGENWSIQQSGTTVWLRSVFFKDSLSGWIVGDSGKILRTTNGGITWFAQASPVGTQLTKIIFADNLNGIISSNSRVIKTTDGGETWLDKQIGDNLVFNSVFLYHDKGWIVGKYGIIYYTNNYGNEWVKKSKGFPNHYYYDVFFIDEFTGWVVGYGGIFKTEDGGQTWNEKNSGISYHLNSVFFINNNIGWAAGGPGIIIKTTDGGDSWFSQTSGTDNWLEDIYFINDQIGFAVGSFETIIKTTDGGTSWQEVHSNNIYNSFSSVHFIDANIGWVCADNESNWERLVLKTTNGGITWTLQLTGNYLKHLRDIYFVNNNYGWACGTGNIYKTTDGGNSWQHKASQSYVNSLKFIDINTGWLVGEKIYKTTNGGNDWIEQIKLVNQYLWSVCFINSTTGWAVGNNGVILKTLDGGGGGVVPVEMTSFLANISAQRVNLTWNTATELNNRGFEIERSFDKSEWRIIGFREGKGTTSEPQNYTYIDDISEISVNKIYYRLKQVDFNGTFEYSDVVEVEIAPLEFSLSQNHPNPFNPSTIIGYQLPVAGNVTLILFDVLGREVATLVDEYRNAGRYEVEFTPESSIKNPASGLFFYQLKAGDFVETKKMLLIK